MPKQLAAAFRREAGPGFVYADLVLRICETDPLTRILVQLLVDVPASRALLLLALGFRAGERRGGGR